MKHWKKISVLGLIVPQILTGAIIAVGCFNPRENRPQLENETNVFPTPITKHEFYGIDTLSTYLENINDSSIHKKIKLLFVSQTKLNTSDVAEITAKKIAGKKNQFTIRVILRSGCIFLVDQQETSKWVSIPLTYTRLKEIQLPILKREISNYKTLPVFVAEFQTKTVREKFKILFQNYENLDLEHTSLIISEAKNNDGNEYLDIKIKAKDGYAFKSGNDCFLEKSYELTYHQLPIVHPLMLKNKFLGEMTSDEFLKKIRKMSIAEKAQNLFIGEVPKFKRIDINNSRRFRGKIQIEAEVNKCVFSDTKKSTTFFDNVTYEKVKLVPEPIVKANSFASVYSLDTYITAVNQKIKNNTLKLDYLFTNYQDVLAKTYFAEVELERFKKNQFFIKVKLNAGHSFENKKSEFKSDAINYEMVTDLPIPHINNVFRGSETFNQFMEGLETDIKTKIAKLFGEISILNEENTRAIDVRKVVGKQNCFNVSVKLKPGYTYWNDQGAVVETWTSNEVTYVTSQKIDYLIPLSEYSGTQAFAEFITNFEKNVFSKTPLIFSNHQIINQDNTKRIYPTNVDENNKLFSIAVELKDGYMFADKSIKYEISNLRYKQFLTVPEPTINNQNFASTLTIEEYIKQQNALSTDEKVKKFIANNTNLLVEQISNITLQKAQNLPNYVNISVNVYPQFVFDGSDNSRVWKSLDIPYISQKVVPAPTIIKKFYGNETFSQFINNLKNNCAKIYANTNGFDPKLIKQVHFVPTDENLNIFMIELELQNEYVFGSNLKNKFQYTNLTYTKNQQHQISQIKNVHSGLQTLTEFVDSFNQRTLESKINYLNLTALGLTKKEIESIYFYPSDKENGIKAAVKLTQGNTFANNTSEMLFTDLIYKKKIEIDQPTLKITTLKNSKKLVEYAKWMETNSIEEKVEALFFDKDKLVDVIHKIDVLYQNPNVPQVNIVVTLKDDYVFKRNYRSKCQFDNITYQQIVSTPVLKDEFSGVETITTFVKELPTNLTILYDGNEALELAKNITISAEIVDVKTNKFRVILELNDGYIFDDNLQKIKTFDNLFYHQKIWKKSPKQKDIIKGTMSIAENILAINQKTIDEKMTLLFADKADLTGTEIHHIFLSLNDRQKINVSIELKDRYVFEVNKTNKLLFNDLNYLQVKEITIPKLRVELMQQHLQLDEYIAMINANTIGQKVINFFDDEKIIDIIKDVTLTRSSENDATKFNINVTLNTGYVFKNTDDEKHVFSIKYSQIIPTPKFRKQTRGILGMNEFLASFKNKIDLFYASKKLNSQQIIKEINPTVVSMNGEFDLEINLYEGYVFSENLKDNKKYIGLKYLKVTKIVDPKPLDKYMSDSTLVDFIKQINQWTIEEKFRKLFKFNRAVSMDHFEDIILIYKNPRTFDIKVILKSNYVFSQRMHHIDMLTDCAYEQSSNNSTKI